MKILIIHGSPRRGNTWNILNLVKDKISQKIDAEYDLIELSKTKLSVCIGCFNCIVKSESKCPHFTTMNEIVEKIGNSDAIIITSPVYSLQITSLLKNFIDHMSYNFHRPKFFKKRAFIITTTAGVSEKNIANYLEEVVNFWGITSVYKVSLKYRGEVGNKDLENINKSVKQFVSDYKNNIYKSPSFKNVAYYNAWRCMSTTLCEKGNPDYEYWTQSKLCNYTYHPDVKIGKVKSTVGNIIYKQMSKSMIKNKAKNENSTL